MKKRINRRSMRKSVKFKPSHDFLSKAVAEYLENGGTITKLEFDEKTFEWAVAVNNSIGLHGVDEFLMGD